MLETSKPRKGTETCIYRQHAKNQASLETSKPRKGTETVHTNQLKDYLTLVRNIKAPEGDGN